MPAEAFPRHLNVPSGCWGSLCFERHRSSARCPKPGGISPAPPVRSSYLFEAVADAVQRLDHVEVVVDLLELLAQPLDVAVDGAVVDVDLIVVGRVHQRVARLDHAGPLGERLQDQELGDRQRDGTIVPMASMALRIELELAALENVSDQRLDRLAVLGLQPAQDGAHALDDKALREGLGDVVVGPHLKAEQFVDLLVLGGEEDDRHVGLLAHAAQKLHAVHARHFDIEDSEIGRIFGQGLERGGAIAIGPHFVAFGLERHPERGQDVSLVIDQRDRALLFHVSMSLRNPPRVRALWS